MHHRVDLANQTFQKPHHSEDDKFWGALKLDLTDNAYSAAQNTGSKPASQTNCEGETSLDAHLFIIKSPSKTHAKRIAKFNRIRTLDPVNSPGANLHQGSFFSTDVESKDEKNKFEFELPSESRWIFNTDNLKQIPNEAIKMKRESVQSTFSSNQDTCDQRLLNSSPMPDNSKELNPTSKQSALKNFPNIKKIAISHIRTETSMPFTSGSIRTKPQSARVNTDSQCNNSGTNTKELYKSMSSKVRIELSSPARVSPKVVIKNFPSFFHTPTSKHSEAMSELSSDTNFLVGRLAQIQEKTPIKTAIPKRILKPRNTHYTATSESLHTLEHSSSSHIYSNITLITDSKGGNTGDLKANLNGSLLTSTTNSTNSRDRRKQSLTSKIQANVLRKIFKSGMAV